MGCEVWCCEEWGKVVLVGLIVQGQTAVERSEFGVVALGLTVDLTGRLERIANREGRREGGSLWVIGGWGEELEGKCEISEMGSDGGLSPVEAEGSASSAAESVSDRVTRLAKECRALQETVSSHTSRWQADSDVLSKQAVALVASMKELERDVYAASERKEISHYVAEKVPSPSLLLTTFFPLVCFLGHFLFNSACTLASIDATRI